MKRRCVKDWALAKPVLARKPQAARLRIATFAIFIGTLPSNTRKRLFVYHTPPPPGMAKWLGHAQTACARCSCFYTLWRCGMGEKRGSEKLGGDVVKHNRNGHDAVQVFRGSADDVAQQPRPFFKFDHGGQVRHGFGKSRVADPMHYDEAVDVAAT